MRLINKHINKQFKRSFFNQFIHINIEFRLMEKIY
jgi:hypothetical protein